MRKTKSKRKRVWIYVDSEDARRIAALLEKFEKVSEAAAMSTLLSAALRGCESNGYACLPREFSL